MEARERLDPGQQLEQEARTGCEGTGGQCTRGPRDGLKSQCRGSQGQRGDEATTFLSPTDRAGQCSQRLLEAGLQAIFEKLRARLWSNFLQLLVTRKDILMKGGLSSNFPDGISGDRASWTTRQSLTVLLCVLLHSPKEGGGDRRHFWTLRRLQYSWGAHEEHCEGHGTGSGTRSWPQLCLF